MAELKRTSENSGHYHLAYLKNEQSGITSVSGDVPHVHQIAWRETVPPVLDPTGQQVLQPAIPGHFYAAESNGHIHNIEEVTTIERTPEWEQYDEEEDVLRVRAFFKDALQTEESYLDDAIDAEKFYMGDQWHKEDKNKLNAEDRTVLTLNEIEGKIDSLSGFFRQNRYDIVYRPLEDGDSIIADVVSSLAAYELGNNNFKYREVEAFEDAGITGRGNMRLWIDYSEDIRGKIKIRDYPYDKVVYGEHRSKDCEDLEYLCAYDWMSVNSLCGLYPDKAKAIKTNFSLVTGAEDATAYITEHAGNEPIGSDEKEKYEGDGIPRTEDMFKFAKDNDFIDKTKKRYKVIELHELIKEQVKKIVNLDDDFVEDKFYYEDLAQEDRDQLKTIPGLVTVPVTNRYILITTTAGSVLLTKQLSEFKNWSMIPAYAKKRGNKIWGKVESMKDMQRMINKVHSHTVDVLARMSNYGWFYDADTFKNEKDKKDFKKNAAKPGFTQEVSTTDKLPQKVEGSKFPSELVQLQELMSQKMTQISVINNEMIGMTASTKQSSNSFENNKLAGLNGNEFLFDNFSLFKLNLGRVLLEAIQIVYGNDPTRIWKIMESSVATGEPVELAGKPITAYTKEEIIQRLTNVDFTQYDVVVGESPSSPTRKMANFRALNELAQGGYPIPPKVLFDSSDLPPKMKREIDVWNQQQMQNQAQQSSAETNTEIIKTIVANMPDNLKTPEVMNYFTQLGLKK